MDPNLYIEVWCLLIDQNHRATFGEPFPVHLFSGQTTHDVKTKIREPNSELRPVLQVSINQIEIWKCKSLKLSARDSFGQTKKQLRSLKFSEDENSDVQHIGVSLRMRELALKDSELLLALVPQIGPGDDCDDNEP